MRTFLSDNNSGLCPEALQALIEANDGRHEKSYGDDGHTTRARAAFHAILGPETRVWFVATGTAANTLAIAALSEQWQKVLCHEHSHYNCDESTCPERVTGCRTVPIHAESSKLTPAHVEAAAGLTRGDVHEPQPGVLTISNPTEFGEVYTAAETREICSAAHEAGYRVHVDGARFANAVASLGCDPRALTIDAGVDALSFGGTKNGMAAGEAICLFPQGDRVAFDRAASTMEFHRKSTGHLLSKHRFVTAPFARVLADGSWLRHAGHANAMARELSNGFVQRGLRLCYQTDANGVFVELPAPVDEQIRQAGHAYYRFGDPRWHMYRFMCSFDTTPADVETLLADAATPVV